MEHAPFYNPEPLAFEALQLDIGMKAAVGHIEEITERLGIVIKKDEELVHT